MGYWYPRDKRDGCSEPQTYAHSLRSEHRTSLDLKDPLVKTAAPAYDERGRLTPEAGGARRQMLTEIRVRRVTPITSADAVERLVAAAREGKVQRKYDTTRSTAAHRAQVVAAHKVLVAEGATKLGAAEHLADAIGGSTATVLNWLRPAS